MRNLELAIGPVAGSLLTNGQWSCRIQADDCKSFKLPVCKFIHSFKASKIKRQNSTQEVVVNGRSFGIIESQVNGHHQNGRKSYFEDEW